MNDFFARLSPLAKIIIIIIGLILLFVVFNYEPASDVRDLETSSLLDESQYALYEEPDKEEVVVFDVESEQPVVQKEIVSPAPQKEEPPKIKGSFFSVQVASLRDATKAKELAQKLIAQGFQAETVSEDLGSQGTWNRVYVGRFQDKAKVQSELEKLKTTYKDCFIKIRNVE